MKKIRIITRLFLVLLLLVHAGCMSTDSNARGGLAGTVSDTAGNPVSGVRVATPDAATMSDANGKWALSSLTPQTTEVTASREKYQTQKKTVEVVSGETTANVAFVLPADGDIYDIQITSVTSTAARVVFSTRQAARGHVRYGINALLESTTVTDNQDQFQHQYDLTGLMPASTYRIKCVALDSYGRTLESEVKTFNTAYTLRPVSPDGLALSKVADSNVIKIDWNPVAGVDSAGYKVYRARSIQGPFTVIGSVNLNSFSDMDVTPGVKYYYRVTSVAGSGDESSPSSVASMLLPGVMSQNAVWTAQEGPYILGGDLTVAPGVSLMIDKGTAISVSKGNQWDISDGDNAVDLIIQGTLVVQGTADMPVTFTSADAAPQAGDWNGITFDVMSDLGASMIKGLKVSFAAIGVKGTAGIPELKDSQFYSCSQAGVYCLASRRAVLVKNVLVDTSASGILVRDTNVNVQILDNDVIRCVYGIVCRDNKYAEVEANRIAFVSVACLDVGNTDQSSQVRMNLFGHGSSGVGLVCRGKDEIRRNTLHANIGIEIKDTAQPIIRSNFLIADSSRNGTGILFSGSVPYNANTTVNKITIQNNAVWNLATAAKKYANSDGTALPASADLAISQITGPALQGGDPFGEFPSMDFSYVPSPESVLKGAGYDFEDIGAEDVPD
jgi:hypothetical protein